MNTNLLKEAIAEADAIKKMAIENAKASLNEAFDSKVKAMLAARLSEEADDLEEEYEESDDEKKMEEEKHEKEEGDDEGYGMEEAEEEMPSEEEADEAFDLDAILKELEKSEEGDVMEGEDEDDEDDKEPKEEEEPKKDKDMDEAKDDEEGDNDDDKEKSVDEEIDIAALLAEMEDGGDDEGYNMEEEADDEEVVKEGNVEMEVLQALAGMGAVGAASAGVAKLSDYLEKKHPDLFKKIQAIAQSAAKAKGLGEEKEEGMMDKKKDSEELQEIKRQAAELAQKVNETNLINAKLLYLNKILRKYNLSEQQKLKVISAFDKANTTKEAKIVHESLDQAFSVKNDNTKVGLKESMGFASKAAGTSTKRVINEGVITDADAQVSRWQKLAGIIK